MGEKAAAASLVSQAEIRSEEPVQCHGRRLGGSRRALADCGRETKLTWTTATVATGRSPVPSKSKRSISHRSLNRSGTCFIFSPGLRSHEGCIVPSLRRIGSPAPTGGPYHDGLHRWIAQMFGTAGEKDT